MTDVIIGTATVMGAFKVRRADESVVGERDTLDQAFSLIGHDSGCSLDAIGWHTLTDVDANEHRYVAYHDRGFGYVIVSTETSMLDRVRTESQYFKHEARIAHIEWLTKARVQFDPARLEDAPQSAIANSFKAIVTSLDRVEKQMVAGASFDAAMASELAWASDYNGHVWMHLRSFMDRVKKLV